MRYRAQYGAWSLSLDFTIPLGCDYETRGDRPHKSSTGNAVSAHGWWTTETPERCPSHAYVEVWLDAFVCYYVKGVRTRCLWEQIDHNEKRVYPGGGSNRITVVRKDCARNDELVSFRTVIDVDLEGVWDSPWQAREQGEVMCTPVEP